MPCDRALVVAEVFCEREWVDATANLRWRRGPLVEEDLFREGLPSGRRVRDYVSRCSHYRVRTARGRQERGVCLLSVYSYILAVVRAWGRQSRWLSPWAGLIVGDRRKGT